MDIHGVSMALSAAAVSNEVSTLISAANGDLGEGDPQAQGLPDAGSDDSSELDMNMDDFGSAIQTEETDSEIRLAETGNNNSYRIEGDNSFHLESGSMDDVGSVLDVIA